MSTFTLLNVPDYILAGDLRAAAMRWYDTHDLTGAPLWAFYEHAVCTWVNGGFVRIVWGNIQTLIDVGCDCVPGLRCKPCFATGPTGYDFLEGCTE